MLSGLRAIEGLANLTKRILVYRGRRTLITEDGIHVWPIGKLVNVLEKNVLWR
jgi:hypothetical protein